LVFNCVEETSCTPHLLHRELDIETCGLQLSVASAQALSVDANAVYVAVALAGPFGSAVLLETGRTGEGA
jgi:hypothetical protein